MSLRVFNLSPFDQSEKRSLEDTECLLSGRGTLGFVGDDVESDGLGQRTALSDRDDISLVDGEGG